MTIDIKIILVEGESIEVYLQTTMSGYSTSLAALIGCIENGLGWSELDARLGDLITEGLGDSVFVIWDQDVFAKGNMLAVNLIDHTLGHPFPMDFEEIFPDWMIADALAIYDSNADYPDWVEIRDSCRGKGSDQPLYERLRACVKTHALNAGLDPSAVDIPTSKVAFAECLAKVANRKWYQPEQMRRLMDRLIALSGDPRESQSLVQQGESVAEFVLNTRVIVDLNLSGKIALNVHPDLWIVDLDTLTAEKVVDGLVTGSPCWASDGVRIVFPSKPTQPITNSEAIRVYDLETGLSRERLRVGNYVCWGQDGRIYGNSLQAKGYQIHALDPSNGQRRVLPLPGAPILACVDRTKDRILIGEQGKRGARTRRVCSIFRINDGKRVWDGSSLDFELAEYSAGAFSRDGLKVSWPGVDGSLWVTDVESATGGNSVRITPPGGRVQCSSWSPDGSHIVFMWSRWSNDPIRIWVVDRNSGQLEPLVEGPFGDDGLRALGCHAWTS